MRWCWVALAVAVLVAGLGWWLAWLLAGEVRWLTDKLDDLREE